MNVWPGFGSTKWSTRCPVAFQSSLRSYSIYRSVRKDPTLCCGRSCGWKPESITHHVQWRSTNDPKETRTSLLPCQASIMLSTWSSIICFIWKSFIVLPSLCLHHCKAPPGVDQSEWIEMRLPSLWLQHTNSLCFGPSWVENELEEAEGSAQTVLSFDLRWYKSIDKRSFKTFPLTLSSGETLQMKWNLSGCWLIAHIVCRYCFGTKKEKYWPQLIRDVNNHWSSLRSWRHNKTLCSQTTDASGLTWWRPRQANTEPDIEGETGWQFD